MKLRLFVLWVALFSAGFHGLATPTNNSALWRPRFATPSIVALDNPGNREFVAEVRAPRSAKGWSACISNDLKTWPCEVISSRHWKINRGTEPGWQVKIRLPADASPELFTLMISNSVSVSTQPQSVSVVSTFASDFYLLHITDEQIVNQMHTDPSGQYHKTVGTWEEMKWMQEPINLIHPRLVLITGDQIDFNGALDGWNNWPNWGYSPGGKRLFTDEETKAIENRLSELYLNCHEGYRVPYVETPGNHDVAPPGKLLLGSKIDWHPISARIYEDWFGQRSWSFRMGDFYVLMHDWSDEGLRAWAEHDYAAASHDPSIHFRLVGQHFHSKWDGAPTGNAAFHPSTCDLMLIGHGHIVANIQTNPFCIYEDGPAFRYGSSGFFNFRRRAKGWSCDQTVSTRNLTNDAWNLFTDHGALRKVRADQPDTMNISTTTVTITNDLPQNFYDGRVRFVLDRGKQWIAQNGSILAAYDCADGRRTTVLVRVNIPAAGSVAVSLVAAGETSPFRK